MIDKAPLQIGLIFNNANFFLAGLTIALEQIGEIVDDENDADVILSESLLPIIKDKRILAIGTDLKHINALRHRHIGGVISPIATLDELMVALQAVARGESYLHSSLVSKVLPPFNNSESAGLRPEIPTPREADVLRYIAQGYTNSQTAGRLGISIRTVESHRANLMDKLLLRNRVSLVKYAQNNGYV